MDGDGTRFPSAQKAAPVLSVSRRRFFIQVADGKLDRVRAGTRYRSCSTEFLRAFGVEERGAIRLSFLAMIGQSTLARAFVRTLKEELETKAWSEKLRAEPYGEHKVFAADLNRLLIEFLRQQEISTDGARVDFEGNTARMERQGHSYPLLGTWTHPDAAVLSPFTVALEFDREVESISKFKQCLSKTMCHVLSGAYNAAVQVIVLREGSTKDTYLADESPYTQQCCGFSMPMGSSWCSSPRSRLDTEASVRREGK